MAQGHMPLGRAAAGPFGNTDPDPDPDPDPNPNPAAGGSPILQNSKNSPTEFSTLQGEFISSHDPISLCTAPEVR